MKKLLSVGLMSIAVLGLAVGSDAHEPPGELLVAVNFPDGSTPMIDGNSSDWSAVPLDQYGIFSETLFSIHGFAGENVDRGGLDASSMQIRHIIGWNDAANSLYFTSRVYDNIHVTQRVDAGRFLQWKPDNTLRLGSLTAVEDPLLARDTWVNQVYVGHNLDLSGVQLQTKLHWLSFRQMMSSAQLQRYGLEERDHFFGIINKASKRANIGRFWIEPRWKSEYIHQTRDLFSANDRHTLQELFSLLGGTEALSVTRLQLGVEYVTFRDFREAANEFKSLTGAIQFKNESAYLGYRLQTVVGLAVERKTFRGAPARAETQSFIAVYAGL